MKKNLIQVWAIILLLVTGCSFTVPVKPLSSATATVAPSRTPMPTSTSTPVPTPTATPIPAKRVANGDYALFLGDYDQALQIYQDAYNLTSDPEIQAAALYGIGRAQYLKGNISIALDDFRNLADQFKTTVDGARAYYFLGQIYTDLERYNDAAAAYQQYLQARPGQLDNYVQELVGDSLTHSGRYQEAASAYQAASSALHLGGNEELAIKIATDIYLSGDLNSAIEAYSAIYDSTTSDYTKAQMDFLIGQANLSLDNTDAAYQRFLDAVNSFPTSIDSYQALVILVNDGQPVSELNRGLVDYFAGQYNVAIQAFDRYLNDPASEDPATAHYYKALAARSLGEQQYPLGSNQRSELAAQNALPADQEAISEWQTLIQFFPGDRHWLDAWEDIAYTQWAYLDQPALAAQTLLTAVSADPQGTSAPGLFFDAARYYERANQLQDAAQTWESLADKYPSSDQASQALVLAGVSYYRLETYDKAQADFQRALILTNDPSSQAEALLWVGKSQQAQNDLSSAQVSWQQASTKDPTGYFSDRARDLLLGLPVLPPSSNLNLGYDLRSEKINAETWMRSTFSIDASVNLDDLGSMSNDPRLLRGKEFMSLGLYDQAQIEFEDLLSEVQSDPVNTFRLIQFFLDQGLYRQAILASRQVLTLAGMDDAATLTAPIYFNHVRFGLYFKDQVMAAADAEGIDLLLLFSLIRQESLFDGTIQSSAGATGLTQLMPATADEVSTNMGWPDNFSLADLTRPVINIRLGAHYLMQYKQYLNSDLYAILAAYNGGPGNSLAWENLASGDPDLFLEVIRLDETRTYVMRIVENYDIYKQIYTLAP